MAGFRYVERALAVAGAIAIVVSALHLMRDTSHFFRGTLKLSCIDANLCIGDAWPSAAIKIDDDKHGVTALFCYGDDGKGDFLFLQDILAGKTCAGSHYAVELRNPSYRTLIEVRSGKVIAISNGPLHVLDP